MTLGETLPDRTIDLVEIETADLAFEPSGFLENVFFLSESGFSVSLAR